MNNKKKMKNKKNKTKKTKKKIKEELQAFAEDPLENGTRYDQYAYERWNDLIQHGRVNMGMLRR